MKPWFNVLVLASLLLSQFAAPLSARSAQAAPAMQEGGTETPTSTPAPETETPVPTNTSEPVPGTPTAEATESPTPAPPLEAAKPGEVSLRLSMSPEFLTPKGRAVIHWEIGGLVAFGDGLDLHFLFPAGMLPEIEDGFVFDEKEGLLIIPVVKDHGQFTIRAETYMEKAYLSAILVDGKGELARSSLQLIMREQFELSDKSAEIRAANGRIMLKIPAGTFAGDTTLEVGEPSLDGNPLYSLSGQPFEIKAQDTLSKADLHQLGKVIELEVSYSGLGLSAGQEQNLYVYWLNPESGLWEGMMSWVDPAQKTVTTLTDHFSVFDIGVNNWQANHMPTVDAFQVSEFTGAGSFSLPIEVPAGPGGMQPSLSLSYNSQVVDQAHYDPTTGSTTTTLASWVGMGWSLDTGYIERDMHGTPGTGDRAADDTYLLSVGGVSTRIAKGADGIFHAVDENYWKISYSATDDNWLVWDKAGNIYYFGDTPTNVVGASALTAERGEGIWDQFQEYTWRWSLQRARNIHGKDLTYTYYEETKTLTAPHDTSVVDTASYPATILYPNERYRIQFERESREDYFSEWVGDNIYHQFERTRLKAIHVQQDADGNGSFETEIRRYEFEYADDEATSNVIFPAYTFPAGGKMSTLLEVQQYGLNNEALPPYTFTYGDNVHLTSASNGYGGSVLFEYDNNDPANPTPWYYDTSARFTYTSSVAFGANNGWAPCGYTRPPAPWAAMSGSVVCYAEKDDEDNWDRAITVNGTAYSSGNYADGHNDQQFMRPGRAYKFTVTYDVAAGKSVQAGMSDGLLDKFGTATTTGTASYIGVLPYGATVMRPLIKTTGGEVVIRTVVIQALPTFSRVISKQVSDRPDHTYETSYSYIGAAVNDIVNSAMAQACPGGSSGDCYEYFEEYSEFRGHESVTATGPDDKKVVTSFNQDDALKGRPSRVQVMDGANDLLSETLYSYGTTQQGTILGYPQHDYHLLIYWAHPTTTEARIYDNNDPQSYTATRTLDVSYDAYGNLTEQQEQVLADGAWTSYRKTVWEYYPNTSPGKNLTGLPARVQVKNGAGTTTLADTLNLYDGSSTYNTAPSVGKLTGVRTRMDDVPRYSQMLYEYDGWGNITTTTTWTGYGTATAAPTSGGRTSYVCYGTSATLGGTACTDDGYHTFPLWSKNEQGHVTSLSYNYTLGVPLSETDPNNAVTSATYDNYGRITSITRPPDGEPTLTMSYTDAFPFTTTITQRVDASTDYTLTRKYDGMGRNYETTAGGVVTTTEYDAYGRVTNQSVPGGSEETVTTYDVLGRPLMVTAPDGTHVSYAYNGLTTTVTDAKNQITTSVSDVWGRTISVTPPTGPGVTYTYDELDRLKTAARGTLVTTLTYDNAGRKTAMSDPDMGTWSYAYDALDMTGQTEARGCTLTLSYDLIHRLTSKTSSGTCGTQVNTTYTYDAGAFGKGRRTGMTDASGSTSWSYDARGRAVSETKTIDSVPYTTSWTYNSADLPTSMTYPDNETVSYGYNARMLLETLGSYVTGTEYDDAGRITARSLGNGLEQEFGYYPWNTQGGRLQQILTKPLLPPQNAIQNLGYSYDPAGNTTQITDSIAIETQDYEYDALDRLTEWRVDGDLAGQYGYNPSSGNLTAKGTTALSYASPPGNPGVTGLAAWWGMDETTGTRLDSHGTNHLTDHNSTGYTSGVQNNAAQFVPANNNYLTAADSAALSTGDIDFTIRAHVYLNNVTTTTILAMKGEKDNMNRRDFTLFVDGTAHAIGFRVGNGTTSGYVLSPAVTAGRWYTVTAWHDSVQNKLNIQLDNGTVQSISYASGAMDTTQPLSVGAFADGTYLLDGRIDELALYKRVLTSTERTWLHNDGKGRSYADLGAQYHAVLSASTQAYTCPQGETCDYDQAQSGVNNTYGYDANGNQTTRTINGVTLTLSYDAEGRMVSVTGQGITASFTYDGDGKRVKSAINGTSTYFVGTHYEVSNSVVTKYYYAGSSRVAMKVGASVYYLLTDHLGSTSLTTSSNGSLVSELRYSAWGGVRYSSGSTPTDYTFTGQYSDSDINLLDYGSRRYDPELGRFISPDSIVPLASQGVQAWDRYAYVSNDPIRYIDPTGHMADKGDGGVPGCTDPVYCKNGKPRPPTEIKLLKIYLDMADESDIAFNYPIDGCYARAEIMLDRITERYGEEVDKIWAQGYLSVNTNNPAYGTVTWGWHVAPVIPITQSGGSIVYYVIDPSIADEPITVDEWLGIMNTAPNDTNVQITSPGEAPVNPSTGQPYPGSGYWLVRDPTNYGGIDGYSIAVMQYYYQCGLLGKTCEPLYPW